MHLLFVVTVALATMCQEVSTSDCQQKSGANGAVYIRWGHRKCPHPHTVLVYSGYAGGSKYKPGGGNSLCLPEQPDRYHDQRYYGYYGEVWGTEYELYGKGPYHGHDLDVPCAVCQSRRRLNSMMIPGKQRCPYKWHREYKGLLMSDQIARNSAEYVCVDEARMPIPGSSQNINGKLLYPVKARCNPLRCPPYKNHEVLGCVVCTK